MAISTLRTRPLPRCRIISPSAAASICATQVSRDLPGNLSVGGDLDLTNTAITTLPETLSVAGGINLYGSAIITLPDNFSVGGYLNLYGTSIATLPDNLSVGDTLDIRSTAIRTLPENLFVGGNLYLAGTLISMLPASLFLRGRLDFAHTAIASATGSIIWGNVIRANAKRSYAAPIAAAQNPAACLKRLVDNFDEPNGFAEWVTQPHSAVQEIQQAAPQWEEEEYGEWSQLFQAIGKWQEAAQPGGDFPLERDGSAYGFEIEVRNQEILEVRTLPTTSQQKAKEYLEQVKQYFCVNKKWFPEGYYWNMHLNMSLTAAERKTVTWAINNLGQIAHLLITPNNPYGRNIYNASITNATFIKHVTEDTRCPGRGDAARLEMKQASIHADLDVEYMFVCLDVIKELIHYPQRIHQSIGSIAGLVSTARPADVFQRAAYT